MRKLFLLLICVSFLAGSAAWGEELSVESLPPSVIATVPSCGALQVDAAATNRIEVTFSKDMTAGSWSWTQMSKESFPEIVGKPRYLDDHRTCVVDVKLEPNKTYVIWLNSRRFRNFKDTNGNSAVPYLLVFQTR